MTIYYDTGYGWIELNIQMNGYLRTNLALPKSTSLYQVSVRTWGAERKLDIFNKPIPPKSSRCILTINQALDELKDKAPAGILLIMLEQYVPYFKKLSKDWIVIGGCAFCKTNKLSEEAWLSFIEEWFYAIQ
jgi:hypothetical protein